MSKFGFGLSFIISFIFCSTHLLAQGKPTFNEILMDYQYNKYELAAEKTETFIDYRKNISKDTLITLLEINAVSNFSISEKEKARASFLRILKINEKYSPDPKLISPKIISFFNQVRNEYFIIKENIKRKKEKTVANQNIILKRKDFLENTKSAAYGSMLSLILPGSGHIYMQKATTKNVIITIFSSTLLFSSVYSYIVTNKLEKEYLNTTDVDLLQEKYDKFNSSFKTRNILIASYFVVWVVTQLDFFWFSSDEIFKNAGFDLSYLPSKKIYLSLKIPL